MSDYFALLAEPRRPWLDPERLKQKFIELSAACHPDRFHTASETEKVEATARYAELNTAYQTLRNPKDRLLHLLVLESGAKPKDIQRIPPGTMDLFVEVGQLCREVDEFLKAGGQESSPMLRVQRMERGFAFVDQLNQLQERVRAKESELVKELQEFNAQWDQALPAGAEGRTAGLPLERLEQIYRIFSYIGRWQGQIHERQVQLAVQ